MADIDQTNPDQNKAAGAISLSDEVLSAVPMPNRATRRKMAALGDAVPVPPPLLADTSDESDVTPEPTVAQDQGLDVAPLAAITPTPQAKPAKRAAARKLPTAEAKTVAEPSSAIASEPAAPPEIAAIAVPPSVPAMQAIAPASLTREPTDSAPSAQSAAIPKPFPVFSIKDMTMDMSTNFTGFQTAMTEAQAKAQAAFEKSSSAMGEMGTFAKGNVEAMVASGKILAEGVQEIGSNLVAESRTVFETMTGDIKELAAAKSPTDFLKIQSDMLRKNFDSAVAYGSKNSETFLKLMSDAAAPLSGRVSLAVEKVRQTATSTPAAV